MSLSSIINQINNLTGYNIPSASGVIISQSAQPAGTGSVNNIIGYINNLTGYSIPNTNVQFVSGSNVSGPVIIYTPYSSGDLISTNGIAPGQIIRADHILRIIYALSGITEDTIIISGSFLTSGSNVLNGTLSLPFIDEERFLYVSGGYVVGIDLPPSASYAISSSYSVSSSFANVAISASYAENATYSQFALTASYFTGSISNADYAITASHALSGNGSFSGSFSGSGADLSNIPASAIIGLNLSQISSGSYSASISEEGLLVNNRVVADSFTGSLYGTASWAENYNETDPVFTAVSGTFATTSSFNSFTSSYNTGSFTGSFVGSLEGTASWAENAVSSSYALTASYASNVPETASYAIQALSASHAETASFAPAYLPLTGGTINGNVTVNGTASVTFLHTTYISSSIIYSSGSNQLGDNTDDVQTLIGTVVVSGSQQVTGSLHAPHITGSLQGTASWARNAQTASYVRNAVSASHAETASYAVNATNAINAATASNILGGKAPHVPYFITDTTLATSSIYQSGSTSVIINQDANTTANPEALYVWQPSTSSINVISGKGNLDNYLQLNIQNTNQGPNASSDVVATANNGNENTNYIDMGVNSENYSGFLGGPNDAYVYNIGENLWIGNYSDGKNVYFFNSSSEAALITLTPSNTVDIPAALNAPDITGSLEGTASWAKNVISASHAINSDFAGYAQTAGSAANGGVTQIIAGSGITVLPSAGVGAVTVIAGGGGGGVTILSGSNVTQSFSNSNTWNFTHNLGVLTPVISVFDSSYNQVIPESIQLIDTASAIITFPTLESGFAVATVGGVSGNALSSSYSLFSTYADTASFYVETDPVFVARSASLATTGSNVFRGTQTISGSVILVNGATGSLLGTASFATTASYALNALSASFATTSSYGINMIVSGGIASASYIDFNLNPGVADAVGRLKFDSGEGTLQLGLAGGNVIANIGEDLFQYVYNSTGAPLTKGQIVYISGSQGNRIAVKLASAAAEQGSANTLGFVAETIAAGSEGWVQTEGNLRRLNTAGLVGGQLLYLSTTPGAYTQTIPTPPNHSVRLGYAERIDSTQGSIYIKIDNGYEIGELHDLVDNTTTSSFGDILVKSGSVWINSKQLTGSYSVTGSLTISGSSTFTNIGPAVFTGSVDITGSTTQTGNNTLIGNTILSGSIGVSGSQTFYGVSAFYGNHTLSGSNTITGNTIMSGSIRVSGSSTFNNSEFIVTGSTSILGDFNVKGTSVFSNTTFTVTGSQYFTGSSFINGDQSLTGNSTVTGSLNVIGNINVVSGSSFTRWGNKLFNSAQFANTASIPATQNVSASFNLPLTYFKDGISITSGSRITFENTGLYNIQYVAIANQGTGTPNLRLWFKKTGSNIDNSGALIQLQNNSQTSLTYNFAFPFNAGEYAELWYHTTTANTSFPYAAAGSGFPASPSIIVTVTQIA